jgi:DNA phosphorothioation-dependent restriction protein DptG
VFFELGQELLVLLTKLLAGDERIPYKRFLERLADYGLAPQDRDEAEELANVMRSMQLLERHSDAGEAMYVSHFL